MLQIIDVDHSGGSTSGGRLGSSIPDCATCSLRRVAVCGAFADHSPEEFKGLARKRQRVKARALIYRSGTFVPALSVIREGWAIAHQIFSTGRRQIFDFRIPGDATGLRIDKPSPVTISVQAITDLEFCTFDRQEFIDRSMGHPALAQKLYGKALEYIATLEGSLAEVSLFPAKSRIAFLILQLRGRMVERGLSEGTSFAFPITQTHIADALGLTTAHVNRTLKELRREGTLSLNKGHLTIHDLEQLSQVAR